MKTMKLMASAVLVAGLFAGQAQAANFSGTLSFDDVASGSVANSALGGLSGYLHFENADVATDDGYDPFDASSPFHWVNASATYGDVLVKNDGTAVSGTNVLWNDHQPILVFFNEATKIQSFSIQQDTSGYGNLQTNGSYIAFLDSTGHEIAGENIYYTQGANGGLTITLSHPVENVSAILLAGGVSYDNMSITTVPEAETYAMMLAGLGLMGLMARRRLV